MPTGATNKSTEGSTEQVVSHVRGLIDTGELRPGDRLPAERDLAVLIGVSRPTVRAGLRALAAMGVVRSRHGSGTYIPDGPTDARQRAPQLPRRAARVHARRHVRGPTHPRGRRGRPRRRTRDRRAGGDHGRGSGQPVRRRWTTRRVSCGTTSGSIGPSRRASGNPIVASLVEMVSALYYERRRETAERATDRNLHDAAEAHRRIYQAIRSRDAEGRARRDERPPPAGQCLPGGGGQGGRRGHRARGCRTSRREVAGSTGRSRVTRAGVASFPCWRS